MVNAKLLLRELSAPKSCTTNIYYYGQSPASARQNTGEFIPANLAGSSTDKVAYL
jgi:hypothetical protein